MKKITTEEFIRRAIEVHGNTLDYTKSEYIDTKTKVIVTCRIHGDFTTTPNNHLRSNGCPKCTLDRNRTTTEDFVQKASLVHGDWYDYSRAVYSGPHEKVHIICPEHGDFLQAANSHLKGIGCTACGYAKVSEALTKTHEEFVAEANEIHNELYTYNDRYTKAHKKIRIVCSTHGEFLQKPIKHLQGQGCPTCKCTHTYSNIPTMLYYVRLPGGLYKIGITTNSIGRRYGKEDSSKMTEVKTWQYNDGKDAYEAEQSILRKYKAYKYKGMPILTSGNSELFTKDVLGLDTKDGDK